MRSILYVEKSREILKQYWGFENFRPLQEEIVDSAIYQNDTLAILPTGGGKSICFQVPGIALSGLTLVISPLIALMEDQVSNLQKVFYLLRLRILLRDNWQGSDVSLQSPHFHIDK